MASAEEQAQPHPGGQQLDLSVYPLKPKRVSRACDYCRKKRIKCSAGERPCMNCLLYHATCTDSGPASGRAHKPRRHKRLPSLAARDGTRQRASQDQGSENHQLEVREEGSPQSARPTPTVISLEEDRAVELERHDHDHDGQAADGGHIQPGDQDRDFNHDDQLPTTPGILSSSDPWDSNLYMLNVFDFADSPNLTNLTGSILPDFSQFPTGLPETNERLPTPSMTDADGSARPIPPSTRQPNVAGVHFLKNGQLSGQFSSLLPGLFLKKDAGESRYQGLNSIGATLSSCLMYARNHSAELGGHSLLQYLIQGITYMDEANICVAPRIVPQDLPDWAFVQHGVELFFKSVYPRYPIVSQELRHSWTQWYDGRLSSPDPIQFMCVCLMVALGTTAQPTGPTDEMKERISALHQRAWSMMDSVLAHPYTGSVQVILLHTLYLTQQGKLGIAWSTCGIALRMAESIGLHRHTPSDLQLSDELVRLRARLWWVAFSLDAFLSLCESRPTGTSSDKTDTKIEPLTPQECPDDCEQAPGPMIYVWHVTLACVANQIADVIGREKGANERLHCLAELDKKLLAWRDGIPPEFRPEQENLAPVKLRHHVSWLHLQFFNVSRTLHWTSMLLTHIRDETFPADQYPRLQSSEAICVESARSLIRTSNSRSVASDTGEIRIIGAPSAYFLAATATIFMYILKEPRRLSAAADVEYLRAGIYHLNSEFFATQVGQSQEILMKMLNIAETVTKPMKSINSVSTI